MSCRVQEGIMKGVDSPREPRRIQHSEWRVVRRGPSESFALPIHRGGTIHTAFGSTRTLQVRLDLGDDGDQVLFRRFWWLRALERGHMVTRADSF